MTDEEKDLQEALATKQLLEELNAAQARVKELEQDKARLDWLEKYPEAGEPYIVYHPPSDHITWRVKDGKEHVSLRAAIDTAMKEGQQ